MLSDGDEILEILYMDFTWFWLWFIVTILYFIMSRRLIPVTEKNKIFCVEDKALGTRKMTPYKRNPIANQGNYVSYQKKGHMKKKPKEQEHQECKAET